MLRSLNNSDLPQYLAAQNAAFGTGVPPRPDFDLENGTLRALGWFDGDALVGKLSAYPMTLWLGDRALAVHGVADVTVDICARGHGIAKQLFAELLRLERAQGVMASVLYPSVPAIYRALGYHGLGARDLIRLDPRTCSAARVAKDLNISRAHGEASSDAYAEVTAGREGVLMPPPPARPAQTDLVVSRHGAAVALVRFDRTDPSSVVCEFLVARDAAAWSACLAVLGTETGVLTTDVWSTPTDPCWEWYPTLPHVVSRQMPMVRVVDPQSALATRGWPMDLSGSWCLTLEDPLLPEISGGYRITIEKGTADVVRTEPAGPVVGPSALAALFAGRDTTSHLPVDLSRAAHLKDWVVGFGF